MSLKTKYQYTYFIEPYLIDKSRYDKYILKLLKDKRCKFKIFEKEKDIGIYNYFLPKIRNYIFPTFELRDDKLKEFQKTRVGLKSKLIANQPCACFIFNLPKNMKGKVDKKENSIFFNIENVELICFNSGICFFTMKTNLEGTDNFDDILDFNYKFKDINSEFSSLKNFERIRIQTDIFKTAENISELINEITGIKRRKMTGITEELVNSRFYTYSYVCLESNFWNEKGSLETNNSDFLKFVNVLPSNYFSDFNKEKINRNLATIDKYKYYKISLTKLSSNLICSGIDPYNYTKLPFEYENEYFYTFIIGLYQKMLLRKLNSDFSEYSKIPKIKEEFIIFTEKIWENEITLNDNGTKYYKTVQEVFELNELYDEIKNKYEIVYKSLNIEKNNTYFLILIILLICSFALNLVNIFMIIKLM